MNNQRGELVTSVMVIMMVGMMIFGIVFMRNGHCGHNQAEKSEHQHEKSGMDQHHMQQGDGSNDAAPARQEIK